MATLDVSPTRVAPNQSRTVTWIGSGTSWLSAAPTFTPSGLAGVSVGAVTVVSDTVATATVTYGTATGILTWTDSTTSQTRNQRVGTILRWVPPPREAPRREPEEKGAAE